MIPCVVSIPPPSPYPYASVVVSVFAVVSIRAILIAASAHSYLK